MVVFLFFLLFKWQFSSPFCHLLIHVFFLMSVFYFLLSSLFPPLKFFFLQSKFTIITVTSKHLSSFLQVNSHPLTFVLLSHTWAQQHTCLTPLRQVCVGSARWQLGRCEANPAIHFIIGYSVFILTEGNNGFRMVMSHSYRVFSGSWCGRGDRVLQGAFQSAVTP